MTETKENEPDAVQALVIEPAFCEWCVNHRRGVLTKEIGVCCLECFLLAYDALPAVRAS